MAAMNKSLARTNKTRRAGKPTQEAKSRNQALSANEGAGVAGFREEGPNQMRSKFNPSHNGSNEQIFGANQQVRHAG
jgi:hypothetical protein